MHHQEAELLLTEYVLGRLPDQQAQAVAQALADDAQLRTLAEFLQWLLPRLRQLDRDPAGRHPTGEQLVAWTLNDSDDDAAGVAAHLRDCAECRRLSDLVRDADRDLAAAPVVSRRRSWVRLALAATICAGAFAFGLTVGRHQEPAGGSGFLAGGAPVVVRLAGITRGASEPATVTLARGQSSLLLLAEQDPWTGRPNAADFAVVVRLARSPSGETVWTCETAARALWSRDLQALVLVVPVRGLRSGDHLVTVTAGAEVIYTGALRLTLP
jgi:hypothetical protein